MRIAGYAGATGDIVLNWNLEISEPPEPARHQYIFPQFAFGGGWESTLMVQSFGNGADCTFSAQDRFLTIREHFGNLISETSMRMPLGAYQWAILKTETPPGMAASSGMAILDCDEEVSANTLFSLRVEGSLVARAVVEPAEEIRPGGFAQLLADHRDGSRFGVAVANLSSQPITVDVRVTDVNGQEIYTLPVKRPGERRTSVFCGRTCNNTGRPCWLGSDRGYWIDVRAGFAGLRGRGDYHYSGNSASFLPTTGAPDSLGEYCELERTGVAVDLDAANRIFTTLPVVPVP